MKRIALLAATVALAAPVAAASQITEAVVRGYLWPSSRADFEVAAASLGADEGTVGISREAMDQVASWMKVGRSFDAPAGTGDAVHQMLVDAPGGRQVPVLVRLPSAYSPDRPWPLMFAMHGGPPGSVEGARRSAQNMLSVWTEAAEAAGWIIASPAMVDAVSRDGRTEDRLPYEIFQPAEARAVIDAVREHFNVDSDRMVSTGISLGSNFSIAYGAAHPDWFSAIVPVSTEGESRERLLRNLALVPTYVLNGAQDQNIRGVSGPRALNQIMTDLGHDLVYQEFSDRAHEGFQEHYPGVLEWIATRPRSLAPSEIVRVPHSGIVPVDRRVHWIETDARQGLVRAEIVSPTQIEVTARRTGTVTVFLNDDLVDLDRELSIVVNGQLVYSGPVRRSARVALEEARRLNDERRIYSARVVLPVPDTPTGRAAAAELSDELAPTHAAGTLSFWEMYAVRALEERFPSVGFDGREVTLPDGISRAPEQIGVRVDRVDARSPAAEAGLQVDDILVSFGGEPFFEEAGGVPAMYHWLVRELRSTPSDYELVLLRDGLRVELSASYALGPYRTPGA